MNIKENILEALRSINSNLLRALLTSAIITFGIMALVGILTTIEGMQGSVNQSFENLGVNTFDVRKVENFNQRIGGLASKPTKAISYREATAFNEQFKKFKGAKSTILTAVAGTAVIKYGSEKTNPNTPVFGTDDNYIGLKGYKIMEGRNFVESDLKGANKVAIIGFDIASKLFPKGKAVGKDVVFLGDKYSIIGVLAKKGSLGGGGDDRIVLIPLITGRGYDTNGTFSYTTTASVAETENIDEIIAESTAMMRLIRGDKYYMKDSFQIQKADAMMEEFNQVTGYLRLGGFGISFITLLGASIALMNIMMVSVTERTREIGIRKALGATPGRIRMQFLMEAIVICILGGLAGVILGIFAGNIVSYFVSQGKGSFTVPWNWTILGLVVCVVVGLLSGYYPASKASKMDPIESLRYE